MNPLDRTIEFFAPQYALRRRLARSQAKAVEKLSTYPQATPGRMDGPIRSRGASADFTLEMQYDRRKVVDRARELERTNVLAEGLLSRSTEAVVGDGFKLQVDSGDELFDKEVEERWLAWCEMADYREILSFSEILGNAFRSKMRDGDLGLVMMADGTLRTVEADEIASPQGGHTRPSDVDGVELDNSGRPIAYHVFNWDPNVLWSDRRQAIPRLVRIPAEQMIFIARRLRAGQTRGVSAFTALFWILEQIDDLEEAVTVAARMAACIGIVIKSNGPTLNLNAGTDGGGTRRQQMRLEPGMAKHLEPGEDIEQITPTHPSANLNDHVRNLIRFAGIPFGLPLEMILRDFTTSNYSNTRAALLQAWHTWERQQSELKRVCTRVFRWKFENWFPGVECPKHDWRAPGWAWIDPVAEVQATMLAIDSGLDTVQDALARQGKDFHEMLEKRRVELEQMKAAGMPEVRSNMSRDPAPSLEDQIALVKAKPEPSPQAAKVAKALSD